MSVVLVVSLRGVRHFRTGESAIWNWAPIITKQCPECGNSPSYHENSSCEYDETPPEKWSKGLVGFKPTAVFDISQIEGEPLPQLETEAYGDAGELVPALLESAEHLDVDAQIVSPEKWEYGEAKGVCKHRCPMTMRPRVEVIDIDDRDERAKREVEAEAVAYIVGRYFDLDMSGSAFYLAAWSGDDPEAVSDRLGRISNTAQELIDTLERE